MKKEKNLFMKFIEKYGAVVAFLSTLSGLALTVLTIWFLLDDRGCGTPAHLEYRALLLDSSDNMNEKFDKAKTKWESGKEAIGKELKKGDKRTKRHAFRQFGGGCDDQQAPDILPFDVHNSKDIQNALMRTEIIGGKATLLNAIDYAIGDFSEEGRLGESLVTHIITVITGSGKICHPSDTTEIKKRLNTLGITLKLQIIPMGLDEVGIEAITQIAKGLGEDYKILPASTQEQAEMWIEDPAMGETFAMGKNYWLAGENQKAISKLEEAAKENVTEAMRILGDIYAGNDEDKAAVDWYEKGAEAGDVESMNRLGIMYRENRGVDTTPEENHAIAMQWFEKASEIDPDNKEARDNLNKMRTVRNP